MSSPTCTKCGASGPTVPFRKDKRYKTGFVSWCKPCEQKYGATYYKQHKETANQSSRKNYQIRRRGVPASVMFYSAMTRAKKIGVPFKLEITDIRIPSVCPILGIPINPNKIGRGPCWNSPSLDRIVPALGYVPGNVRVISHRANTLRCNATVEELEKILDDARCLAQFVGLASR